MLYPAAIEIGNDTTAFGVIFPDVAGCFSAGDSYEEALVNARKALKMHFELLADLGELPPTAHGVDDYCEQPESGACISPTKTNSMVCNLKHRLGPNGMV